MGAVKEGVDRAPLGSRKRLHLRNVIDKHAIALIRGDAPRRGVGLHNEPLFFEHRHIVAYGRGTHTELVAFEQRLRTYGFAGCHVIFHDRAEDAELALIHVSHPFAI